MEDIAVTKLITKDKIDILIDLSGHTSGNRLRVFTGKPALVQLSYLGYPNTTGLSAMGYRITDTVADPDSPSDVYYKEKLLRLNRPFLCYRPPEPAPSIETTSTSIEDVTIFGSFNFPAKISPHSIRAWAEILRRVGNSRLLRKYRTFSDAASRQYFAEHFASHGIQAK